MFKKTMMCGLMLVCVLCTLPAAAGRQNDLQAGVLAVQNKDAASAQKYLEPLAQKGNPIAQFQLGVMHADGRGVSQDPVMAVKFLRAAAEQGYAPAQSSMGIMSAFGKGIKQNDQAATEWFKKAALQGYGSAQVSLGLSYEDGLGIVKNLGEAVKWYRKAAQQGVPEGQYSLALMYIQGLGVTKNEAQARFWLQKAAKQGHGQANDLLQKRALNYRKLAPELSHLRITAFLIQQVECGFAAQGFAEKIALHQIAAPQFKQGKLGSGFHRFGDDLQIHGLGQRNDGSGNSGSVPVDGNVAHKRLVDFQCMNRKTLQVT